MSVQRCERPVKLDEQCEHSFTLTFILLSSDLRVCSMSETAHIFCIQFRVRDYNMFYLLLTRCSWKNVCEHMLPCYLIKSDMCEQVFTLFLKSVDVSFPPFFTPQYCSSSVYFPNMFALIYPCQCIWGAQAMDCLSTVGKGLNLLTPDIDPGQVLTVSLHPEKKSQKKNKNAVEESGVCVCVMCVK